jgi:hypothetical protein
VSEAEVSTERENCCGQEPDDSTEPDSCCGHPHGEREAHHHSSEEAESGPNAESSEANFSVDQIESIVELTYNNLGVFVRDTEIAPEISAKYQPGLIFREKGLTYATYRVGGQAANHRFAIFSNHLIKKNPDPENYGLCIAEKGSVFKVIGRHDFQNSSWIILLHLLGDNYWRVFKDFESPVDEDMVKSVVSWLTELTKQPVIPELTRPEWVDSCKYPMGIDDNGEFFPL